MLRVRSRSAHQAGRKRSAMMRNQGDHRRPDSGRISSRSFSCDTYLAGNEQRGKNDQSNEVLCYDTHGWNAVVRITQGQTGGREGTGGRERESERESERV